MVSTTVIDRTEKLGITLPISLLKQIDNKRVAIFPEVHSLEERLRVIGEEALEAKVAIDKVMGHVGFY